MDVLFFGAPGAGKGTQAQILRTKYGYRQLSTGDLLRENCQRGTELGRAAQTYMDRGDFVPDDLIIAMVKENLPPDGASVIFDGFPRTVAQARALDQMLKETGRGLPYAVHFDVPRDVLEARLLGRWTNPRTGRVYHDRFNPPRVAGIDDADGGPLIQRPDDKPEIVRHRLDVFEEQTEPLIHYYDDTKQRRYLRIDASRPVAEVTAELLRALETHTSPMRTP